MATLYRALVELLRDADCRLERQGKGSHEIRFSPITQRTVTVPANLDGRPLANAILKQAGLPKAFLASSLRSWSTNQSIAASSFVSWFAAFRFAPVALRNPKAR